MLYDYYAAFTVKETGERSRDKAAKKEKENINDLVHGNGKYAEVGDRYARSILLLTAYSIENKLPYYKGRLQKIEPLVYARVGEDNRAGGLKAIVHHKDFASYLSRRLYELKKLGVDKHVDLDGLPKGSWYLEVPLVLKSPFYSHDDIPFHIIDNPLQKEKVFGVPFTAATTWKGCLRWSMMKVHLEPVKSNPELFAKRRLQHLLLFGSEKGEDDGVRGLAAYLDRLGGKEAEASFRKLCRKNFQKYRDETKDSDDEKVVHFSGMLHFSPTFWTKIEMSVINPHDRRTKAGKNPIYYEVVPEDARGVLRLLFVPLHRLKSDVKEQLQQSLTGLTDVAKGLEAMLFKYGFSAKKSVGWGVVEDSWAQEKGSLRVKGIEKIISFSSLKQLKEEIERMQKEVSSGGELAEKVGR